MCWDCLLGYWICVTIKRGFFLNSLRREEEIQKDTRKERAAKEGGTNWNLYKASKGSQNGRIFTFVSLHKQSIQNIWYLAKQKFSSYQIPLVSICRCNVLHLHLVHLLRMQHPLRILNSLVMQWVSLTEISLKEILILIDYQVLSRSMHTFILNTVVKNIKKIHQKYCTYLHQKECTYLPWAIEHHC